MGVGAIANCLRVNKTLTSLDLSENALGWLGAETLARGIKDNDGLVSIDLRKNMLGRDNQEGLIGLASALACNQTVTQLDLSSNFIGDEAAAGIASMLHLNRTITDLRMWRNDITPDGVPHIANSLKFNGVLAYLDLRCNDMRKRGAKALLQTLIGENTAIIQLCALPFRHLVNDRVRFLDLQHMELGIGEAVLLAHFVKFNEKLERLDVQHNHIREDHKQNLRDLVGDPDTGEARLDLFV
jgi:Ran GTPase-activating protein (RanGAP) involved in mRNA processing and transport